MKQKSVPGYRMFFGHPQVSYEDVVCSLSSTMIISMAITINNELEADLPYKENQHRLLKLAASVYTNEQISLLKFNLERLEHSGFGEDAYELFRRRYLLALIIKELKRNQKGPEFTPGPGVQFSFLLAYLLVIDEEHAKDKPTLDHSLLHKESPFFRYRVVWMPYIRQYQFNESVSVLFELLKLIILCHYAKLNWRPQLKKYLESFDLKSIGQLANSYNQVFKATRKENSNETFKKLVYINPPTNVPAKHLQSLSINSQLGNTDATLLDIKKRPLFFTEDFKYKVIDPKFFYKHIYKGPFFDLVKTTGLEVEIGFNEYSKTVSREIMEEICFKIVLETLKRQDGILLHPENKSSASDGYYRIGNVIFLIEFKAYVLNDKHVETPDFDKLKYYLDENFIRKENGKAKGAGQLINQIKLLNNGKLNFDNFFESDSNDKYTIYPIICHNEFHFSLPGINEYINEVFLNELTKTEFPCFEIKNLTLINLDWLFDLGIRGGDFVALANYVDQYWKAIAQSKDSYKMKYDVDTFLDSMISFDEMYQNSFIRTLPDVTANPDKLYELIEQAGISQAILDEIV